MTSFEANTSRNPCMGFEPMRPSKVEAAGDIMTRMKKVHEETQSALIKAQDEMKRFANRKQGNALEYKVGDKVWLSTENFTINLPSWKLGHKQIGPYPISEIINPNAIHLKFPKSIWIHDMVNTSHDMPYKESTIPGQKAVLALPVTIESHEEYKVETIVDSRLRKGKLEYLVYWNGFTIKHDS